MISFFILLVPSNTLVSLLNPRACMHLYRLLNQSVPEHSGLCLIYDHSDQCKKDMLSHVSRDPMGFAHMIIQQKFLCLAAYEGFVLKISTLDTEQQLALVHINM